MATGYETPTPLKALIQSNGDVIIAEFTSSDVVSIQNGGTGSNNVDGVRQNLELARYNEFPTFLDFDSTPETGRLAKDNETGDLYYSDSGQWIKIGTTSIISGSDISGTEFNNVEVESLSFIDSLVFSYDPLNKTATVSVDLTDINSSIDSLTTDLTNLTSTVSTLSGDLTNLNSTVSTLSSDLTNLNSTVSTLSSDLTSLTTVVGNISTDITNVINQEISTLTDAIGNFEYNSHTAQDLVTNDGDSIVPIYDPTIGKYTAQVLPRTYGGAFIMFYGYDGTRDDIDLLATYDGSTITSAKVRFWNQDGTQDDIDMYI